MKVTFVRILIAAMTAGACVLAPAEAFGKTCVFEGVSEADCPRVERLLTRWGSKALTSIALAGVEDPQPITGERAEAEIDQANAKAKAEESIVGPCRYDESEERVEVQKSAFKLSDEALTRCLAQAYAQARYHEIEGQWLNRVGEHEAWIVQGGALTKVAVDRKLERPVARMLWASFATRELATLASATPKRRTATAGRAIASAGAAPASAPDKDVDKDVNELLGL